MDCKECLRLKLGPSIPGFSFCHMRLLCTLANSSLVFSLLYHLVYDTSSLLWLVWAPMLCKRIYHEKGITEAGLALAGDICVLLKQRW